MAKGRLTLGKNIQLVSESNIPEDVTGIIMKILLICLLVLNFHQSSEAGEYESFDDAWKDLKQVYNYIEGKEFKKAQTLLEEVKTKIGWYVNWGLYYPQNFRNTVKYYDIA